MNVENFDGIAKSNVFLVLGTRNYLDDVREHGDCFHLIQMARALKKPALLLIEDTLNLEERQEIVQALVGFEILDSIPFSRDNMSAVKQQIASAIKSWKANSAA